MAVLALNNAVILAGQANLSGASNSVELTATVDDLDATVFGSSGYRSRVAGMRKVESKVSGLWDAGSALHPDDRLFADLGVAAVPYTVSPDGASVAGVSYFTRVLRPSYMLGGSVGDLLAFDSSAVGDGAPLVRGQIANNGSRTATSTTTVLSLSAPTASQRVYCALHVTAVSGTAPSMTVTVQGDDSAGFASPASVATSSAITGVGSHWLVGDMGVTTDGFYRLSLAISGTSPSFTFVASIGVA